ncbi:hypothetical protein MJC1_04146 [Methylocystis sp. MJC1]|jgi:predicted DNA-binding transcriptional regulator AlpA|uniref:helix-turn-helix transcriptional regulator n=1 Tax=Methylocystis sp. MJC1 TaxID=2654282 RepID=UPI0013EBE128|nr:helix-turn-helix domain-containing protein [Methylocystis sp. MJC1]KAF2988778.1 hypothetical protein MJC1_04146 [Methylocystis sp. MJC1]
MEAKSLNYKRLLSPLETAHILGVSVSTLAKWRMTGLDGPNFVKLGSRVKYDLTTVEAWIRTRARTSTSDHGKAA